MTKAELLENFDKEHNGTYTLEALAMLIVEAFNLGEEPSHRVYKLHFKLPSNDVESGFTCYECSKTSLVEYPCSTIKALDIEP